MFGICFHFWQEPHISHEPGEQWGSIVFSPDKSQLERHVQIRHWQHNHSLGTSPARSSIDKPHTQPMRHKAQDGRFIHCFLNDARCFQAAAKTFAHQSVVKSRAFPPWKPDEGCVNHVAQPEVSKFSQRMSLGRGQCDVLRSDLNPIQFAICLRRIKHVINKARIQPTRSNGFDLFQGG